MGESSALLGTVKDGVIVPARGIRLREGAIVKFVVETLEFTPEEQAEFAGWEKLGDEAWAMIDWGDEEDTNAPR